MFYKKELISMPKAPLMEVVYKNSNKCAELFLGNSARYASINRRGNSILHIAASTGNMATIQYLVGASIRGINPLLGRERQQTNYRRFLEKFGVLMYGCERD
jgi:ankyrin repeat protein